MAKIFYTDIDLKGNQLRNPVLDKLSGAPSNPKEGQLYYNSGDKLTYQCIGFNDETPVWIPVTGSVNNLTPDANKVVVGVSSSAGKATLDTDSLQNLVFGVALPKSGSTALQSLQQVMETVDRAVGDRVVRNGQWTGGKVVVSHDGTSADESGFSIQNGTMNGSDNTEIPTSKAIADYVASLGGGLDYKGVLDWSNEQGQKTLPTTGVKNGDVWVVAKDTNAEHHYRDSEEAQVGDLYVASVAGGTVTWAHIPLNFTVTSKDIAKLAPQDGLTVIAVVDGKDIKVGLQNITVGETATGESGGNVIDGITFNGNNVATLNKKFALQGVKFTNNSDGTGVITNISKDSNNIDLLVTRESLETNEPENLQYVKGLSQAANGKVTITAGRFEQTIDPNSEGSVDNAPSTKATKDYVTDRINGLDVDGLNIVVKDETTGEVWLQRVVKETDGKIGLETGSGSAISLQKVASTGQAADVKVPADSGIASSETHVLGALQGIQNALQGLDGNVVKSIGGMNGVITLGDGLVQDTSDNKKELKAKVKSGDYVTVDGDGIHLDSGKIDGGYNSANTNIATVESIQAAVGTLDVNDQSLSDGSATAIKIYGIYEVDGKIGIQNTAGNGSVKSWNLDGTYDASNNKIALQSTVENAIQGLDGSAQHVINIHDYTPESGESAHKVVDIFGVVETDGVISTGSTAEDHLYITQGVTASNPIVTKNDIDAMDNDSIKSKTVKNPVLQDVSDVCTWNVSIGGYGDEAWYDHTIVELRDGSENVVEADVQYDTTNGKIVVKINGSSYAANTFKLVVHTKSKYTVANVQA